MLLGAGLPRELRSLVQKRLKVIFKPDAKANDQKDHLGRGGLFLWTNNRTHTGRDVFWYLQTYVRGDRMTALQNEQEEQKHGRPGHEIYI